MIDLHLIDYDKCHKYARSLCGQYGIPRCDAEDIGSDAFLAAIKRSWRVVADKNPEAVANRLMYTSVLNVINRRNTFANRIIREADDIDATQAPGYGEPTDDEVLDDAPSCCRTLAVREDGGPTETASVQQQGYAPTLDDWQNPFWLRLFKLERQKLRNSRRRLLLAGDTLDVIKMGLKDSRLSLIKAELHLSGTRFQTILQFFRYRFDLCFQALRAYRA